MIPKWKTSSPAALTLGVLLSCSDGTVKPASDTKVADNAAVTDLIRDIHVTGGDAAKDGPWGTDGQCCRGWPHSSRCYVRGVDR